MLPVHVQFHSVAICHHVPLSLFLPCTLMLPCTLAVRVNHWARRLIQLSCPQSSGSCGRTPLPPPACSPCLAPSPARGAASTGWHLHLACPPRSCCVVDDWGGRVFFWGARTAPPSAHAPAILHACGPPAEPCTHVWVALPVAHMVRRTCGVSRRPAPMNVWNWCAAQHSPRSVNCGVAALHLPCLACLPLSAALTRARPRRRVLGIVGLWAGCAQLQVCSRAGVLGLRRRIVCSVQCARVCACAP